MPDGVGPGGETRFEIVGANAAAGETEAPVPEPDAEPPEHEIARAAKATMYTLGSGGLLRCLGTVIP
jgi:hypothetical protein